MSKTPFIVGIGGTLRERSLSRAALREALRIANEQDTETDLLDLRELDLPMYHPDLSIDDFPESHRANLKRYIEKCRTADAMIWSSPTYHGTVSGIFKNAIDFIELLGEDDPAYLNGKAIGLISINDSKTFSAMSNSVHELQAWLAPTHVQLSKADFDGNLKLTNERAIRRITRLVGELMSFVKR